VFLILNLFDRKSEVDDWKKVVFIKAYLTGVHFLWCHFKLWRYHCLP
jgi:hypothetical protein